jgi:acyl carrier protein
VEFLGRADQQVKVRGYRVEPGEVEAALRGVAGVEEAAVVARGAAGEVRLVGYLAGAGVEARQVEAELRRRLPAYMVPAALVVLPGLPRTPNGKLDRRALAALPVPVAGGGETRPLDALEREVAEVWAEVLPVEAVGADDDFFALGGHSLLATRVLTRLRARLGVELPLRALFESRTVAALAAELRGAVAAGNAAPRVAEPDVEEGAL